MKLNVILPKNVKVCGIYIEEGIKEENISFYYKKIKEKNNITENVKFVEVKRFPNYFEKDTIYLIKNFMDIKKKIHMLYMFQNKAPIFVKDENFHEFRKAFEMGIGDNPFMTINSKVNILTGCAGQGKTTEFLNIIQKFGKKNKKSFDKTEMKFSYVAYMNDRYEYQKLYIFLRKIFRSQDILNNYMDFDSFEMSIMENSYIPLWLAKQESNKYHQHFSSLIPFFWNDTHVLYLGKYIKNVKKKKYHIFYDEIRLENQILDHIKKKIRKVVGDGIDEILTNNVEGLKVELEEILESSKHAKVIVKKIKEEYIPKFAEYNLENTTKRKRIVDYTINTSFPEEIIKLLLKTNHYIFLSGTFLLHINIIKILIENKVDNFDLYLLNENLSRKYTNYRQTTLPLIVSLIENNKCHFVESVRNFLLQRKGKIPGQLLYQWLSCERFVSERGEEKLQPTSASGQGDDNPAVGSYFLPTIGPICKLGKVKATEKLYTKGHFCISITEIENEHTNKDDKSIEEEYMYEMFKFDKNKPKKQQKTLIHYSKSSLMFFNVFTLMAVAHKDLVTNYYLACLHVMKHEEFLKLPRVFGKIGYQRRPEYTESLVRAVIVVVSIMNMYSNISYMIFIEFFFLYIIGKEGKDLERDYYTESNQYIDKKGINCSFTVNMEKEDNEDVNIRVDYKKIFPFCIPGEYDFKLSKDFNKENEIKKKDLVGFMRGECTGVSNSAFDGYGKGNVGGKPFILYEETKNDSTKTLFQNVDEIMRKTSNELCKQVKGKGVKDFVKPSLIIGCIFDPKGSLDNENGYFTYTAKWTVNYEGKEEIFDVDYIIFQVCLEVI